MKLNFEPSESPRIVAANFQPAQLTRAREYRGLTKAKLAELIGKTPAALSQFESGTSGIEPETIARLALALGFPIRFFAQKPLTSPLELDRCHFRLQRRSASQYERRQALRTGEFLLELATYLEEMFAFPDENIRRFQSNGPPTNAEDIERLADEVRHAWGLTKGPLPYLLSHLEANGIMLLPLASQFANVDAFSAWWNERPVMWLGFDTKPSSRTHFDAGHELGHLFMHEDVDAGDLEAENQANHFASAFLLPRDTFSRECPCRWSYETFLDLKKRWYVSIQALVERAYRLNLISEGSRRSAYIELNKRGERTLEPGEWNIDRPQLFTLALSSLDDVAFEEITVRLGISKRELSSLLAVNNKSI